MSSSNYTYLGPIIKIADTAKLISTFNTCSNEQCVNYNRKDEIKKTDNFCGQCGSKITTQKEEKNIGKKMSVSALCRIISGMEKFEDYVTFPEMPNALILTMDEIKKHGFYLDNESLNFKEIEKEFKVEDKICNFIKEIENNGLKKLLDENLSQNAYTITYGLITFGSC